MTQNEEVKRYLESGGRLTGFKALRLFGTMRLAARVNDLRKTGLAIKKGTKAVLCANGRTAHVAEYYLEREEA